MADILVADHGQKAAAPGRTGSLASLAAAFTAESDRRALWLPVCFGSGIALYFGII